MPPQLIIALRHGEKPANAEDDDQPVDDEGPGIDQHGVANPSSLTLRGWQRAGALAGTWLCGTLDSHTAVTVAVPEYEHSKRHRPYQTVAGLAARLNAAPEPWVEAEDVDGLHTRMLASAGTLVVCWEHKALAELATRLAGDDAPPGWPAGRFDVLWLFTPAGPSFGFEQRDQCLLAGDVC